MPESSAFTWLCEQLEKETNFSRIEARGTVRLALKDAGLIPADLTPSQASSVARRLLAAELTSRGIAGAEAVCQRIAAGAGSLRDERTGASPDEVFRELAKR